MDVTAGPPISPRLLSMRPAPISQRPQTMKPPPLSPRSHTGKPPPTLPRSPTGSQSSLSPRSRSEEPVPVISAIPQSLTMEPPPITPRSAKSKPAPDVPRPHLTMLPFKEQDIKSMSTGGVKQSAAPPIPQEGMGPGKKPPGAGASSNGSGPAPLTYSSGEPADDVNMNEVDDRVALDVYLPSGKSARVVVDSNIPMRDLLVHLAAKSKVSPSGHTLQVVEEESGKPMDYKPSQTFGSLGATSVYIVPKNKKPDWSKAVKANKAAKSFEITHRFTINLPGGQKAVMRVSPQLTLEQVFARVCQDKSLDSRRYTPQHPVNPLAPLDLKATIAESKLNEINLIHAGAASSVDSSRSMPDLHKGSMATTASQDPSSWYMPGAGETKKKKSFLSFLSKSKDKKFKPQETHYNAEPAYAASHQRSSAVPAPIKKPSTPPPERRNPEAQVAVRPKTMYVAPPAAERSREQSLGAAAAPRDSSEDVRSSTLKGAGRKRPAPPPPQKPHAPPAPKTVVDSDSVKVSVAVPVASATSPTVASSATTPTSLSVKPGAEASAATAAGLSRLHSRNSSDSSGYHELTLSGADSPEAARVPTTFKTSIDTTSIESSDNLNGDSGIQETSPVSAESSSRLPGNGQVVTGKGVAVNKQQQQVAASSTLSQPDKPKPLPSTKKKKAPPPPPGKDLKQYLLAAKETPVQDSTLNQTQPLPPPVVAASIPEVEDIPPPLAMDVDTTDAAELHTQAERTPSIHSEEDNQSISESDKAFNLEEILDSVTFDEEPLHFDRPPQPPAEYREDDQEVEGVEEEEDTEEMAMMETGSVLSEEVQIPEDIKSRPCEFIPPPPPVEPPPPEDEEDMEAPQYVDKGTVVGDDNSSLAPASLKSSPVATHKRSDSQGSGSSIGSVDTIQGLSLDFEQTIAAGQEALDSEHLPEEEGSGYTTEMARFVAEMSRRTTDNPQEEVGEPSSNNTSISLPDTESTSDTGSVIRHGVTSSHIRGDSKDSQQSSLSSLGRPGDTSSIDGDHGSEHSSSTVCPPPPPSNNAFAMMEEIPAPLETVPPPLEFQNGETEEEEEEEEFTTVTEEYIIPMGPGGLDYSAAMKVSEEEERGTTIVEKKAESSSSGVFRAEPLSILQRAERDAAAEAERRRNVSPVEPAKKEEFVLTFEDLSSVSLVPLRPKVYTQPKVIHDPVPPPPEPEAVPVYYPGEVEPGLGSPEHSHVHLAYISSHGHVHPVSKDSYNETCTDFTVPPSHEEEESLGRIGEEPSESNKQSTLYMPAMRITGSAEPMAFSDDERSSLSSSDHVHRSSARVNLESRTPPDSLSESGSEHTGSRRVSNASSQGAAPPTGLDELQVQYSSLQDQFVLWQQQLQQNQILLAAHNNGSGGAGDSRNDATLRALQMQMQMQQQMMQQLQVSMQALSQQQLAVQRNSPSPQPVAVAAAPPPAPPAPVVATSTVRKAEATKEKTRPLPSRFQPQLDPREELMIAIRSFGGHGGLNRVPAKSTTWANKK